MSNVRLATVVPVDFTEGVSVFVDRLHPNNGTHLLVPVEKVNELWECGGPTSLGISECQDCAGHGDNGGDEPEPCITCNGRGWVLEGGGDE